MMLTHHGAHGKLKLFHLEDGGFNYQRDYKLNEKISEIKAINPAASFDLLLVIALLNAQSKIMHLTHKIESNSLQKNSQDEEKFAETLSTIASYLENLARKMEK